MISAWVVFALNSRGMNSSLNSPAKGLFFLLPKKRTMSSLFAAILTDCRETQCWTHKVECLVGGQVFLCLETSDHRWVEYLIHSHTLYIPALLWMGHGIKASHILSAKSFCMSQTGHLWSDADGYELPYEVGILLKIIAHNEDKEPSCGEPSHPSLCSEDNSGFDWSPFTSASHEVSLTDFLIPSCFRNVQNLGREMLWCSYLWPHLSYFPSFLKFPNEPEWYGWKASLWHSLFAQAVFPTLLSASRQEASGMRSDGPVEFCGRVWSLTGVNCIFLQIDTFFF